MQNIDTDQIIPAEYLTLVPSKVGAQPPSPCHQAWIPCVILTSAEPPLRLQPDEYEKLGSYALIGLPDDLYTTRCAGRGPDC